MELDYILRNIGYGMVAIFSTGVVSIPFFEIFGLLKPNKVLEAIGYAIITSVVMAVGLFSDISKKAIQQIDAVRPQTEVYNNLYQDGIARNILIFCVILGLLDIYTAIRNVKKENIEIEKEKIKLENEKLKLEEEENRKRKKQDEQEEWQRQLDREIERERRLSEVRHESTLKAMMSQIALMTEYKKKGADIEREVFDMRKTMLELEGQENKSMLDEVRQALDELAQ
jgi:flagellar biosynthesis GTPase FlhF